MRKIVFLSATAVFLFACGDDAQKSATSPNNVSPNNVSSNNATNNASTNSATNNASTNGSTNNTSTNNSTNSLTNNAPSIPDAMFVRDLDEAQEASLREEVVGYFSTDNVDEICLVEGYYIASTYIGDQAIRSACVDVQADCVSEGIEATFRILRGEACGATVGDLRACEKSKIAQMSEYVSDFVECTALSESLLQDALGLLEEMPATAECMHYDEVCP